MRLQYIILFITLCSFSSLSQSFYYKMDGEKINLSNVPDTFAVIFPQVSHDSIFLARRVNNFIYLVADSSELMGHSNQFFTTPVYENDHNERMYITNRLVLLFRDDVNNSEKNQIVNQFNLTFVKKSRSFELYECPDPISASNAIFETGKVKYCQPDFYIQTVLSDYIPSDEYFGEQFYLHNTGQEINDGKFGTIDADIDAPEAWEITKGDPNVVVAVIDEGITSDHPDLPNTRQLRLSGSNFAAAFDGSGNPNEPSPTTGANTAHGDACAGIIGATQDNLGVTGIAPLCKIMPVKLDISGQNHSTADYAAAIDFAVLNGADVISNSWNMNINASTNIAPIVTAILNAQNDDVPVVFSAGNLAQRENNYEAYVQFPATEPGVFCVGASNANDQVALYSPSGSEITIVAPSHSGFSHQYLNEDHSFNVWTMDIPAPGGYNSWSSNQYSLPLAGEVLPSTGVDYYSFTGRFGGTSASAPQVAAVIALMKSVNSCMTLLEIRELLYGSTDKVGGFNYAWNNNLPGHSREFGYGRLNAYKAVVAALNHITYGDLYIRDTDTDTGYDAGYPFSYQFDESPDIWVRNQNDGFANDTHENPDISTPTFVYVRIRNNSCAPSYGTEVLDLYWTKAATNTSWSSNWDGTDPTVGGLVGSQNIPIVNPGDEVILQFDWNVLDPNVFSNWNSCLLARIENEPNDPILIDPGYLAGDIYTNNNVSLRNTVVITTNDGEPPIVDGVTYPYGSFVYMGNVSNIDEKESFVFRCPENYLGNPITKEAEVTFKFDSIGWNILLPSFIDRSDIRINRDSSITLFEPVTEIENVSVPANTRFTGYLGVSFLTDNLSDKNEFKFHILQNSAVNETDSSAYLKWQGGVHFDILKSSRTPFDADAGKDKEICVGETVVLNAKDLPEFVTYKWYDENGDYICTGKDIEVAPTKSKKYKLEVTANTDGFKDYDSVTVQINSNVITNLSPNPASTNVTIDYYVNPNTLSEILITNSTNNTVSESYTLDSNLNQNTLNLINLIPGIYIVTLICDGIVQDSKQLLIE